MRLSALLVILVLVACGDEPAPAVDGLRPLDDVNEAPLPGPSGGVEHPEAFLTATGSARREGGGTYEYAHGRGYVRAPLATLLRVLEEPDTSVDRRRVSEWTFTKDIDASVHASWRTHNVVHDLLTVEFDTEWRIGLYEGTSEDPEAFSGRAVKVAGTSFITELMDSVVLRAVSEDVTLVELIRHSVTAMTGAAENEQFVKDFYASLRERAHGRPLPSWR